MATSSPTYKLDYEPGRGIIITGGNNRIEFPIYPLRNDSPLTPVKYKTDANYFDTNNVSEDDFKQLQKYIRIWDMDKDGSVIKKGISAIGSSEIWRLMNDGSDPLPYSQFESIVDNIQKLDDINLRTTTSSWIKPNQYETNHAKLSRRKVYQESGLSPEEVIDVDAFIHNIANMIIDPFKRAPKTGVANEYFPGAGNSLEITTAFFELFGFLNCRLRDMQTSTSHNYELQVANNIVIRGPNSPPPPTKADPKEGWYAGNVTKNRYFNQTRNNSSPNTVENKRALLNVKEMGDVLQVLLMFMNFHISGQEQTMVTGDTIVFVLCIILGLDCVLYQHKKSGSHGIKHFTAKYTLEKAIENWMKQREEIIAHNQDMIACIQQLMNKALPVSSTGLTLVINFAFCPEFLTPLLTDMTNITEILRRKTPLDIFGNTEDENEKIRLLNNDAIIMKSLYKIKALFTYSNGTISFSHNCSRYTDRPTPGMKEYAMPRYVANNPKQSFYNIYLSEFVSKDPAKCMHPTQAPKQVRAPPKARGGTYNTIKNTLRGGVILEKDWEVYKLEIGRPILYTGKTSDCSEVTGHSNGNICINKDAIPEGHDNLPPIDIHREWVNDVERHIINYVLKNPSSEEIVNLYRNDIYRELYEFCDNNNLVITGDALIPYVNRIIDTIIHTYETYNDPNLFPPDMWRTIISLSPTRSVENEIKAARQNASLRYAAAMQQPRTNQAISYRPGTKVTIDERQIVPVRKNQGLLARLKESGKSLVRLKNSGTKRKRNNVIVINNNSNIEILPNPPPKRQRPEPIKIVRQPVLQLTGQMKTYGGRRRKTMKRLRRKHIKSKRRARHVRRSTLRKR